MLAFRLCLALGYIHPDVLLAQLTARQWAEWKAFYLLDPWGDWRQDRRFAMIAAMMAARNGKRVSMDDFMLHDPEREARKKRRERAHIANLRGWFESMSARGGKQ